MQLTPFIQTVLLLTALTVTSVPAQEATKPKAKRKGAAQAQAAAPRQQKKTQSSRVEARTPAEELAGFTVQSGFVVELVASEKNGVINPIDISFDDAGRLWTQTARMYPLDPVSGLKWQDFLNLMADEKAKAENPKFTRIHDLYQLKTKGQDQILILDDPTNTASAPLRVWADGLSIPQSAAMQRRRVCLPRFGAFLHS